MGRENAAEGTSEPAETVRRLHRKNGHRLWGENNGRSLPGRKRYPKKDRETQELAESERKRLDLDSEDNNHIRREKICPKCKKVVFWARNEVATGKSPQRPGRRSQITLIIVLGPITNWSKMGEKRAGGPLRTFHGRCQDHRPETPRLRSIRRKKPRPRLRESRKEA